MKKYGDMTKKELTKLRNDRFNKYKIYENKAEAFKELMKEVNDEQVKRLIQSLRKNPIKYKQIQNSIKGDN